MDIEVVSPIDVEAEVQRYTLVSDDIYVRRYDASTVPDWYRSMVENIVITDPTITDIQGAIDFLTLQGAGYHQSILNLSTADSSINSSLSTLTSQVGANTAGIGNLNVSKVDATAAQAIATDVVASSFGAGGVANAWFTSQISTYASNIAANASSISTLSASLGSATVRIDSVEAVAIEANAWSANASKLITSPDGSITGWSFGDGTNTKSYFQIQATNFKISDGTTGYTPFSISGSNIHFNGFVTLTGLGIDSSTTTIDGGKITTDSITANQIAAGAVTTNELAVGAGIVNGYIQSSDFTTIGGAGFRLKSNAAGTYDDPNIYGAYIRGAKIAGALSTVTYINENTSLPVTTTPTLVKTFTVPPPNGQSYRLHITANLVPIGGNYSHVYYDIRANGVSLLGELPTLSVGLGNSGSYHRTVVSSLEYTESVTITLYARQDSGGFATANTHTDTNISVVGIV